MIEIKLHNEEDFLKIKETLTRIGVASFKKKELYQSCHILHKQKKYYILHFKELFGLDGREVFMTSEDESRRNVIAKLLCEWGLCSLVDKTMEELNDPSVLAKTKILRHSERADWTLIAKHSIGR